MGEGEGGMEIGTNIVSKDESENISMTELKTETKSLVAKLDVFSHKNIVKEASHEDIKSEVSNPLVSPKDVTSSFRDITSQPAAQLFVTKQEGSCCEVSSTCSGNSNSKEEETLSNVKEDIGNYVSAACSMQTENSIGGSGSSVVVEIPQNISTTGVRKITFKFSGRKVDSNSATERDKKISKKAGSIYHSLNVKKLIASGVLDGARVKYISKKQHVTELEGIIQEGGYLCSCPSCNLSGDKVLTAFEFEQHASAKSKHPNNHIYLENGRSIYNIIQNLKTAPFDQMDNILMSMAGSSVNDENLPVWKARLRQTRGLNEWDRKEHLNSSNSLSSSPVQTLVESVSPTSCTFEGKATAPHKQIGKRPSSYVSKSLKRRKTGEGSIKKRDNDLHRALFMPNGLLDWTHLTYRVKGKKKMGGYKKGNGIVCDCCKREISPSQFEAHAGMAIRRQPYRHIYVDAGDTLHDIAIELANGQRSMFCSSNETCSTCGNGGDLVLCVACPQAFHPECLQLQSIPGRDWICEDCRAGPGHGSKAAVDESSSMAEYLAKRRTQIVKAPKSEIGGCALCSSDEFDAEGFNDRTMILCDQCEREYHVQCLRDKNMCDLKELPQGQWFCCEDCTRIHVGLQSSAAEGFHDVPALLLDTINRKHREKGQNISIPPDIVRWRIVSGKSKITEQVNLLKQASKIFHKCFNPILSASGCDLINYMVDGKSIREQDFGGMYTLALMVESTVICAGLIRIFGRKVAELPLVATRLEYQGKGYFQALFSIIETLLISYNVEILVLPAAKQAESIWTNRFGFSKMTQAQLVEYQAQYQLTIFKDTVMLEKRFGIQ